MPTTRRIRPNALGDLRAEADRAMLSAAFLETPDYHTLIETSDRPIVVGRRGTGKSALAIRLQHYWTRDDHTTVVAIAPEEHQAIGLRPRLAPFGDTFSKIRAASRLLWRFALTMETAHALLPTYKFKNTPGFGILQPHLDMWLDSGDDIFDRSMTVLRKVTPADLHPDERIASLSQLLHLTAVETALRDACTHINTSVVFIIDRLDEGYAPDHKGTGLVAGLVHAAIDLKIKFNGVKSVIFLRDNIFRAVQQLDPDYSRNIEGSVLRLHWDFHSLWRFATSRLQHAFHLRQEPTVKIWNTCTAGDVKGRDGFLRCLQHTLYRPRDLLALLNQAFYHAGKNSQSQIVGDNVEAAARMISRTRMDDLQKEYESILPGLRSYIAAFHGREPDLTVDVALQLLARTMRAGSADSLVQQEFYLLGNNTWDVLRALYSIGFMGVQDRNAGAFVFCHDGRAPDRELTRPDRVLIHPCYWMALNCTHSDMEQHEVEEIYDEYDIEVSSETPAIRNAKIQELTNTLAAIPAGVVGAGQFEDWCHAALRICFAKGLRNVELKPNRQAPSRRDVVATNLGESGAWRRIYEDYGTRQVTFEIRNVGALTAADYQQVLPCLGGPYGRVAFVVTRGVTEDLHKGRDVEWVRDLHTEHGVLVIMLTGRFLCTQLGKLRIPQKHDAVDDSIHRLLNAYTKLYVVGPMSERTSGRRRTRRRKMKHRREK